MTMVKYDVSKYRPLGRGSRGAASGSSNALVMWIAFMTASTLVLLGTTMLILYYWAADSSLESMFYRSSLRATLYARVQKLNSDDSDLHYISQWADGSEEAGERVVACYYNTPGRGQPGQLLPADVPPYLCTHINVAFARVVDKKIALDDYQYEIIKDIVKLKKINPKLKILISVGGAGNDTGFSDMVIDHASRKTFIRSIKSILRNYTLDGIDLDWEFPALHDLAGKLQGRERQHFSQLLHEIRSEYIREKRDYLLTVAVAAPETIADVSYDVDQLNLYADFVNIMTYDFHYYTKFTPFTGLNAPLFGGPTEHMYLATLNINYTVNMYIAKGLSRDKIVVGIPAYGHSFTLMNADNPRLGSPAAGFGSLGGLGFVNYPDVCLFTKKSDVTIQQDEHGKVPYLYRDLEWVSYDTPQSVKEKASFILSSRLRGAMIYSLNADDYAGVCEQGDMVKLPLVQAVSNVLLGNASLSVSSER